MREKVASVLEEKMNEWQQIYVNPSQCTLAEGCMGSSLQNMDQGWCGGPRDSSYTFGVTRIPVSSTAWWLEVSGSINKLNIHIRAKIHEPGLCSRCQGEGLEDEHWDVAWERALDLAQAPSWPRLGLDFLSHPLQSTWGLTPRRGRRVQDMEQHGQDTLVLGDTASNRRGNRWGLKMSVINRTSL